MEFRCPESLGEDSSHQLKKRKRSDVSSLPGCLPIQPDQGALEGRDQVTAMSVLPPGMKLGPQEAEGLGECSTPPAWPQSPKRRTPPPANNYDFLGCGGGGGWKRSVFCISISWCTQNGASDDGSTNLLGAGRGGGGSWLCRFMGILLLPWISGGVWLGKEPVCLHQPTSPPPPSPAKTIGGPGLCLFLPSLPLSLSPRLCPLQTLCRVGFVPAPASLAHG